MEKIYATRTDGIRVTYDGDDLSGIWAGIEADSNYVNGDYYKKNTRHNPKRPLMLASYFGSFETTLPL